LNSKNFFWGQKTCALWCARLKNLIVLFLIPKRFDFFSKIPMVLTSECPGLSQARKKFKIRSKINIQCQKNKNMKNSKILVLYSNFKKILPRKIFFFEEKLLKVVVNQKMDKKFCRH